MNNTMDEKEVTFLTEKEIDEIIASISDEIILDCIKEQIKMTYTGSTKINEIDYIDLFETRYKFIKQKFSEYPDVIARIDEIRSNMYNSILIDLQKKFKFSIDGESFTSKEWLYDFISKSYTFFVAKNTPNMINFVVRYIDKEREAILDYYKNIFDKEDLTYNNIKDNFSNEDAIIITKLPEIIAEINVDSPTYLLELIVNDDIHEVYNSFINEYFIESDIVEFEVGFVSDFLHEVKNNEMLFLLVRKELIGN